jgi:hypothetical protein
VGGTIVGGAVVGGAVVGGTVVGGAVVGGFVVRQIRFFFGLKRAPLKIEYRKISIYRF